MSVSAIGVAKRMTPNSNFMKTHNQKKTTLLRSLLVAGIFATTSSHATVYVLDSAYNPATQHTYYLLDTSNWTDAESTAVTLGGHLTTVNDVNENTWIYNKWGATKDLWIGLYDPVLNDGTGAQHAANFQWADGSSSAYRNWRAGEPNSANGGEYYANINAGLGGVWNDTRDQASLPGSVYYGVVEVVPEPSSIGLLAIGTLAAAFARNTRKR